MNVTHNASQLVRSVNFRKSILFSSFDKFIISLLQSCASTCHISQVHSAMIKSGLDRDRFLTSKLLSAVIHDTQYASSIFNTMPYRNIFIYNTMIRSYSSSDIPCRAIDIFCHLRCLGLELDQFTFVTVNKAIARMSAYETGQMIHDLVLRYGFLSSIEVKNSLLNVYSACGRIIDERKLFDESSELNDLVSWNTLMRSYVEINQPDSCVQLFHELLRRCLLLSDSTVLCILSAFSLSRTSLPGGQNVHGICFKTGLFSNFSLQVCTALIKFYCRMNCIEDARRIFDSVQSKDVVLWNCMVDSYAHAGLLNEALALLEQMKVEKIKPNSSTLVGLLSASAESGLLKYGTFVYDAVIGEGLELNTFLGTALVDMFVKCGDLKKAVDIFSKMKRKDVKSWTAMVVGYGLHGQARKAVSLLDEMEQEGCSPNDVTFLAILSACSHGGLVEEAIFCFQKMVQVYSIAPNASHYASLIDLLGRAGFLEEGFLLINSLAIRSDVVAWRALLSACRVHGNPDIAKCARSKLLELDEEHPADSLLISSFTIPGAFPSDTKLRETSIFTKNDELEAKASTKHILVDKNVESARTGTHWIKSFLK